MKETAIHNHLFDNPSAHQKMLGIATEISAKCFAVLASLHSLQSCLFCFSVIISDAKEEVSPRSKKTSKKKTTKGEYTSSFYVTNCLYRFQR